MPIYEYWCQECKSAFEKLRPMSATDSTVECPKCGAPVRKMLSLTAQRSHGSDSGESYAMGGGCGCGGACGCGGHGNAGHRHN